MIVIAWRGLGAPRLAPEASDRDSPKEAEGREAEEDAELLEGGGTPVRESGAHGEAFLENGAEVGREGEVEGGFDGGELWVGEALLDWDVER